MSDEREIRRETDFWGTEHEYIYDDGQRVGEVKTEERGGFLGIGGETVKVEYDNKDREVSYTKQEERGGFLGIGSEEVQVRYDSAGTEIGHSRVEERGGFLGIGSHHVRVEYDNDDNEASQSHTERRGAFLGIGGERVKVTTYTDRSTRAQVETSRPASTEAGDTNATTGASGADASPKPSGIFSWIVLVVIAGLIAVWYVSTSADTQPSVTPTARESPVIKPRIVPMNWNMQNRLTLRGFGTLNVGMTYEEVRTALKGKLQRDASFNSQCYQLKPTEPQDGILLMFTGGGVLSRIDIMSDQYVTLAGAHVGQTQAVLIELYKGRLVQSPHKYIEQGSYFTFEPRDATDKSYRMIFETDGQKVTRFRSGRLPEVAYVEGCL